MRFTMIHGLHASYMKISNLWIRIPKAVFEFLYHHFGTSVLYVK